MKNTILELIAAVLFAAPVVAATTVDSFRQPETPPEPPAVVRPAPAEPPPVPDIWEIVRNDNQAAADICAARGKR